MPQVIKIFIASSKELEEEREQFRLFIATLNDDLLARDIYLKVVLWENFIDAMSRDGLQSEYNKAVKDCDIFVSMFFTKVGIYTEEEFNNAFSTFKEKGRPLVYTYFKASDVNIDDIGPEIKTLLSFKEKLKALKHFYTPFKNCEALKLHFDGQMKKILNENPAFPSNTLRIGEAENINPVILKPGSAPLCIAILTNLKPKVSEILDKENLKMYLPEGRYDDFEREKWRPFSDETIDEFVSSFCKDFGYSFSINYLDNPTDAKLHVWIDDNLQNCIAIIDLMSLDQDNEDLAKKFDTKSIICILMPVDAYIDNSLKRFMEDKRSRVFKNLEFRWKTAAFNNYNPDIPSKYNFNQVMRTILFQKRPIFNKIANANDDGDQLVRTITIHPSM